MTDVARIKAAADARLGHYLINTRRGVGFCAVCTAPVEDRFTRCLRCDQLPATAVGCDLVAPIAYAGHSAQSRTLMYGYKEPGSDLRFNVQLLLGAGWKLHQHCLQRGQPPIDGYLVVPSTSGRSDHPLPGLMSPLLGQVDRIDVQPTSSTKVRVVDQSKFHLPFPQQLAGRRHLVVIDDTWTSGATVQSLAWLLKTRGVLRVTALIGARWLDPQWSPTAAFLAHRHEPFDITCCPVSGGACRR